MSQEEDRIFLAGLLAVGNPFAFVKFGDGEFECIVGAGKGYQEDGQRYSDEAAMALIEAWAFLRDLPNAYLTCWCPPALKPDVSKVADLNGRRFLDHDALLLHTRSDNLAAFYRNLYADKRRKVLVAPSRLSGVTDLLGCSEHVDIPRPNAFEARDEFKKQILAMAEPGDIWLFSASFAAKCWIFDLMKANIPVSCIDLGSAFDPIFIGPTRHEAPSRQTAIEFLRGAGLPI